VWTIGVIGTALGLVSSGWLTQFAELMVLLGSVLVPVGGVFLAHFVVLRHPVNIEAVYHVETLPSFTAAGIIAWGLGFVVYKLAAPIGATLPSLGTSIMVYAALALWHPAPLAPKAP
jgi:purine-cytosine permease-like protein